MPIYQVTANQVWRGFVAQNVFYYDATNTLDTGQKEELADAVRAAWAALDTAIDLDDDWSLNDITLRRVDQPDLPSEVISFTSGPLSGSSTAIPGVPNQIALLISFSAPTTKPRRARSYLAGLVTAHLNQSGAWTTGILDDFAVWAADMDEISVTGETLERVAVEFTGSPPRVENFNRLTSAAVRNNPATQRRRRLQAGI